MSDEANVPPRVTVEMTASRDAADVYAGGRRSIDVHACAIRIDGQDVSEEDRAAFDLALRAFMGAKRVLTMPSGMALTLLEITEGEGSAA